MKQALVVAGIVLGVLGVAVAVLVAIRQLPDFLKGGSLPSDIHPV